MNETQNQKTFEESVSTIQERRMTVGREPSPLIKSASNMVQVAPQTTKYGTNAQAKTNRVMSKRGHDISPFKMPKKHKFI